jgi:hypothetical protein
LNATPIHGGSSIRALERAKNAAYRRRCNTMADYHEAVAAFWRKPTVEHQEAVDVTRSESRKALNEYTQAREQLDRALSLKAAA